MEDESNAASGASARALDTPVTIAIEGEICDATLTEIRDGLQQVRDSKQKRLLLEIASDGGSVYACLGIIDLLRAWMSEDPTHELITFATHAFSAACTLFGLGSTRIASPLSTFMNHACSGGIEGEVGKMHQQLAEAERVNRLCDEQLALQIGAEATEQLCSNGEKYVDAKTAKAMGLATHIGHVRARVDVIVDILEQSVGSDAAAPPAAKRAKRVSRSSGSSTT